MFFKIFPRSTIEIIIILIRLIKFFTYGKFDLRFLLGFFIYEYLYKKKIFIR